MSISLFARLEQLAPEDNAKPMVTAPDGRGYRYGEAFACSARLANRLAALGVRRGDRVAVQVDKSPEVLPLYLAALRAGAAYLPLNTAYTDEEVAYFLEDAEPALLVCRPEDRERAARLAAATGDTRVATMGTDGDGSLLDGLDAESARHTPVDCGEGDLAAILYTSGTTGRPKGAMLTHGNLVSNAEALADVWRFTADDCLLHALPVFHTHGLFVACNVALIAGASMLFLPRFDIDEVIHLLPDCSVMMGVPTFYTRLLQREDFTGETVRNVRLFTSGSAPLAAEVHRAFRERTGHAILERYGMTETNMNTSNPYEGERRPGTVGFPLPGVELRVTDPASGRILPQGDVGVLEVLGPNVFVGYWRKPEKTREDFRDDGFFITGDLGYVDEDGYVHIVGRDKDLVISGGYNVYPREVEQLLDEHPHVAESAVIGLPHPDLGEGVTAVVVPRADAHPDEDGVLGALAGRLARYKQPRRVLFVDALPRNVMGKVQKNVLRERYRDTYSESAGESR